MVPGRPARRRGDGPRRGRRGFREYLPDAVRQGQPLGRRQPLQRPLLHPQGHAAQEQGRHRPASSRRHGRGRHHPSRLPAGQRLPGRPACRAVHGPRQRPGLPDQAGERPSDAVQHRPLQPPGFDAGPFQLHAHFRPGRRSGPAHGQLSRRASGQSLPLFHRSHDRL